MKPRNLKGFLYLLLFLIVFIGTFVASGHCQTAVSIAPEVHPIFFSSSGTPLAGGFLFTYAAGTTTLQNTYADAFGFTQNTDPIPLDSTGSPSNGSTQTGIWLANLSYKFCLYNSAMVLQWCSDNISGTLGLLNTNNTWVGFQFFDQQIVDFSIDNQFELGAPGNSTILDFPPPTSSLIYLHFPNTADTMVGRNTTDTLTNKTLTTPSITNPVINGSPVINGPGTYLVVPNSNATGTFNQTLTTLTGSPSTATLASTSQTFGVIGICVIGTNPGFTQTCGTSGNALIQQSGAVYCQFDFAPTAGDYVGISSSANGLCHDTGASYPSSGQVIGRVLSAVAVGSTYLIDLFGPDIQPPKGQLQVTSIVAGAGAGTGPTVNCLGSPTQCADNGGVVFVTTGSAPSTNSVIATVTFAVSHAFSNCTLSPYNGNTAALSGTTQVFLQASTTGFTITSGSAALTGSTVYNWNYVCNFH